MDLRYSSRELERLCTNQARMQAKLGSSTAKALQRRLGELAYVLDMSDLLLGTGRWEELRGDRAGQWSSRLSRNWRLIVMPEATEEAAVTVLVLEITDYH